MSHELNHHDDLSYYHHNSAAISSITGLSSTYGRNAAGAMMTREYVRPIDDTVSTSSDDDNHIEVPAPIDGDINHHIQDNHHLHMIQSLTQHNIISSASSRHKDSSSHANRHFFPINQWVRIVNETSKFHGALGQVRAIRDNRCHVVNVYVRVTDAFSRFKSTFVPESCVAVEEEEALSTLGNSFKPRRKRKYGIKVSGYDDVDGGVDDDPIDKDPESHVHDMDGDDNIPQPVATTQQFVSHHKPSRVFFNKLQWVKIISSTSSYVGCIGQVRTIWKDKMQYIDIYVDHGEGRFRVLKNTLIPESLQAITDEEARERLGESYPDSKLPRPSKKERRLRNSTLSTLVMTASSLPTTSLPHHHHDNNSNMISSSSSSSSKHDGIKAVQFYGKYQWVRVMAPTSAYFGCIGQVRGIEKGKVHGVLIYKEETQGFFVNIRNSLNPQSLSPITNEEAQASLGSFYPKTSTPVEYVMTEVLAINDVVQIIDDEHHYYGHIGNVTSIAEDGKQGQVMIYSKQMNGLYHAIDHMIYANEAIRLSSDEAQQCLISTVIHTASSDMNSNTHSLSINDIISAFSNSPHHTVIKRRKSMISHGCLTHEPLLPHHIHDESGIIINPDHQHTNDEATLQNDDSYAFQKYQWIMINSIEKSKFDGCIGQIRGMRETGRHFVNAYVKVDDNDFIMHQCNLVPKSMKLVSEEHAMTVLGSSFPDHQFRRRNAVFCDADLLSKGQWVKVSNPTSRYAGHIAQVRGNTSVSSHIIIVFVPAIIAEDGVMPSRAFNPVTTSLVPQSLSCVSVEEAKLILGDCFPSDIKPHRASMAGARGRADHVLISDAQGPYQSLDTSSYAQADHRDHDNIDVVQG